MEQYTVNGMTCAACSARVEKAVRSVDGVTECAVSLLTNSMGVSGSASEEEIVSAVRKAGYEAFKRGSERKSDAEDMLTDKQTPKLKKRFLSSIIFLLILMYFSMGHTMWGWRVPGFFEGNPIAMGLLQMLLAIAVMIINKDFFISGVKSLLNKAPNMDALVAIGSGASFIYSTCILFLMTDAAVKGEQALMKSYVHEFYFESAAMILALITLGKMLEAHSKGKTTDALKGLMKLSPKTALIPDGDSEREIPAEQIKKGDVFIVKSGGAIPADGVIIEGHCSVDESALTGESIPVDKKLGDTVTAATISKSGYVKCEALRVGEDTAFSQIIKMVSEASATKAPIAKAADKVSGVFVPVVISLAIITTIIWMIAGASFGFALARGISVLVISCPCALGLATPVAIMVGSGKGAKNGILFKTAQSLEAMGRIEIVALDKTGTVTKGEPEVCDILPCGEMDENEFLRACASLEKKSEHPLAYAVVKKAEEKGLELYDTKEFEVFAGNGLCGKINGELTVGGNLEFVSKYAKIEARAQETAKRLSADGKTPLYFARNEKLIGIAAVRDEIKEDSSRAVKELSDMGIRVVMLTGDNELCAKAVSDKVGITETVAKVKPDEKEKIIRELRSCGKIAMVGDGINDAPALTAADVGVAIGAGSDIAIDSADVVLMKSKLSDVCAAVRLGRKTLKNIHENLFWAFIYNVIGIPVAAGVLIPLFNIKLNPMIGAAAMSLSSFCVVTNALRLNLADITDCKKDRKIKTKERKKKTMETTLKIEGMMCMHCEGRVKKCLEELPGVTEAEVSHEKGQAIVKSEKEISYELLKSTVEEQGYKVIG